MKYDLDLPLHRFSSLELPDLRYSGAVCVRFDYHLYGADTGSLGVYRSEAGRLGEEAVYTVEGDRGEEWRTAEVATSLSEQQRVRVSMAR